MTERSRFSFVFAASLLGYLGIGATITVLPRFVTGPLGAGEVAVGLVVGGFAITAVICRPIAGRLADARGRRPVFIAGALCMAFSSLLYIPASSVAVLMVGRLLLGLGEGLLFTAGSAWVVDIAPEDRRGRLIGLYGLSIWGGFSLGAPLGEALHAVGTFDGVWLLAAALPLIGAALALRVPDTHEPQPASGRGPLIPPSARVPGVGLFLSAIGMATMAGFVVLHLEHEGDSHGPLVFTVFAVAVVAARLIGGDLPDRIGPHPSAVMAAAAEALGLAIIGLSSSVAPALAGAVLMGVGFSTIYPALALLVVRGAERARQGTAIGTFVAFFDLGFGLGGPAVGAIASAAGYRAAFLAAAVCALGTLLTVQVAVVTARPASS